ncbi:MAG: glycosyltransferase [Aquabacterium sp.]
MAHLALALRDLGHAVTWATARESWPLLQAHGLQTVEAGPAFGAALAEFGRRRPEAARLPGRSHAMIAFSTLFGDVLASQMIQPLTDHARHWRPDLIIGEPAALAAPLVARALGVPSVTHAFGLPIPAAVLQAAAESMAPHWAARGLGVPADCGLYGDTTIEIVPPSLLAASMQPVTAANVLSRRPRALTVEPNPAIDPALLAFIHRPDPRPLVYATFGTLNRGGPAFASLLDALGQMEVRAIVTTGGLVGIDTTPAHVLAAPYVPQEYVLPHCAMVVSHGGSGTMLAALAHGLPQVCLPTGADQFRNADALAVCGAAITHDADGHTGMPSPSALATMMTRCLAEPGPGTAARVLRAEIDAMPDAHTLAARIDRGLGLRQQGAGFSPRAPGCANQ